MELIGLKECYIATMYRFVHFRHPLWILYATLGESYATLGKCYATLGESYATPCESYATPGESYATPFESYATPCESYATPCESYATPGESYANPLNPTLHVWIVKLRKLSLNILFLFAVRFVRRQFYTYSKTYSASNQWTMAIFIK